MRTMIFIDPPSRHYYNDLLFNADTLLNRDACLSPYIRLRAGATINAVTMHTADKLFAAEYAAKECNYYSFGIVNNYSKLLNNSSVCLKGIFIFEPPVFKPDLYRILPELSNVFEKVYLHNVNGDGYSLKNVNTSKLVKYYWPQPFADVLMDFWAKTKRQRKIVIINGNHWPKSKTNELYSKRIEAMLALSKFNAIDLFGTCWDTRKGLVLFWWPFLKNRRRILKIYKGTCVSKYEVLSNYTFALCFENMTMDGYITEKLFDCLYAGTIPLYLGPKDIDKYIPREVYVDCRQFSSWEDLWNFVTSMSQNEIDIMREAGRAFFATESFKKYYNSLENCFGFL